MSAWKYTDATNRIASRVTSQGFTESVSADALPGNTVVLPADPPPPLPQGEQDVIAAKAYAKLNALQAMTPAQVKTWVDANVTNLEQAQDAIKTLAIAVSIMARRM